MANYFLVKGHDIIRESKNGSKYTFLTIAGLDTGDASTFKALYFFKGEFDLKVGDKVELEVKDGKEPGQKIANKPRKKSAWGGASKGLSFDEQKRLKSIELAVSLVIANKVEMKDLEKISRRLNELI